MKGCHGKTLYRVKLMSPAHNFSCSLGHNTIWHWFSSQMPDREKKRKKKEKKNHTSETEVQRHSLLNEKRKFE